MRRLLVAIAFVVAIVHPVFGQTGGPVNVRATDPSTGASVNFGNAADNSIRIHIVASDVSSSGGTSAADNAVFTQGTTAETPAAGLYATSWSNPTAGHNTIFRADINGGIYVNLDKIGTNSLLTGNGATGNGSPRVTIASDNTAFSVNAIESGTWTVQPGNTANTTQWLVKSGPFDACGTTTYDPTAIKIADNTLDVLTGTTTCVETITVANIGSVSTTITVQDTQGTPIQFLNAVPVAPGASIVLSGLGGLKFASGIKYQASLANNLTLWVKGRQ